jgi:hypothetical protein
MKFFLSLVGLSICQILTAQPIPESPSQESNVISKDQSPAAENAEPIDPIQWLMEHKHERPSEVTLVKQTLLPIVVDGKTIGSVTKQQGSSIRLHDFNKSEVMTLINGSCISIPIENTNFLELAKNRLLNSQKASPLPPPQQISNSEDILKSINDKLSNDSIKSDVLLELYQKHPKELLSELEHRNINLYGEISKVFVSGIDHEKVDITLSQKKPYKITVTCDLKNSNRIFYVNDHEGWHNKFEAENGQLFLLSCYNGLEMAENLGYVQKKLVCTERSNFEPYLVKLKSIRGYNLVFEAVSSPQYTTSNHSESSFGSRSTY